MNSLNNKLFLLKNKYHTPFVYVAISYNCNKQCSYCYADGLKKIFPEDMSIDNFIKVINWIKKNKKDIMFIGGEPTIHPNFVTMLEICRKNRLKVDIATNNLYNPTILKKLNKDYINYILINYNNPATYNPGDYSLFVRNLNSLKQKKIKFYFYYKFTSSFDDYLDLISLVKKYDSWIAISPMIPKYLQNKDIPEKYFQTLSNKILELTAACEKKRIFCYFARPVPRCIFTKEQWRKLKKFGIRSRCYVGLNNNFSNRLVINPDLSIFPCSSLYIKGPNVTSFDKIIKISRIYKRPYETLCWTPLWKKCRTCRYFISKKCQGSCLAYKSKGDSFTSI